MAFTNRNFGIEIETISSMSMEEASRLIHRAGYRCEVGEVDEEPLEGFWKVVYDGSLDEGFEVVSPILSGEEGIAEVRGVAKALVAAGVGVDRSCGLHVHVDAGDLRGSDIVNAVKRYAAHETAIDDFMPRSRRSENNHFCMPVDELIPGLVRRAQQGMSVHQLCASVYERYYKLNVAAYVRHGTLEFRQHSGTVNGKKMANWIRFCVNFIEMSKLSSEVFQEPGLFTGLPSEVVSYFQDRAASLVRTET